MANLGQAYDPNETGRQQLDKGDYKAEIVETKIDAISKNNDVGDCLIMSWKVLEGPKAGQMEFQRLNLFWRGNEKTPGMVARIANGQLNEIVEACGLTGQFNGQDTTMLHHRPCWISVAPQKNNPEYNEIKRVRGVGASGPAPMPNGQQQPGNTPPPQSGNAPPWEQGQANA